MTTTPARQGTRRLDAATVPEVAALLERDFDQPPQVAAAGTPALPNAVLLDALDRGEHDRFLVWPGDAPEGLIYASPSGTLVPAGDPTAAPALAEPAERLGWRVLVGDARIGQALLDATPHGVFRRRVRAREQRLMAVEAGELADLDAPEAPGFRLARRGDLDVLVDFACRLHVEDQMGPPIARSARGNVRARLEETVAGGGTWVIEDGGVPLGKADLSLRSRRRGAQIAGVYVAAEARGRGVATGLIASLVRMLLRAGLPGVSLHVRADNVPAIAAYARAGLTDRGAWLLALR
jgi:ribosomal protein S18 acetylase RimI-like enzyme